MNDNANDEPASAQTSLAARLRETRAYLNLSQQFVSEQTGIPRSAISDIERGMRKVGSLELSKFSRLYRFPVSYFLGETVAGSPGDDATIHALARAASDLTEEDKHEVLRFATFLRNYGKSKREGQG